MENYLRYINEQRMRERYKRITRLKRYIYKRMPRSRLDYLLDPKA
jgi:hypothetical protein